MINDRYRLSFTVGGLFKQESLHLAMIFSDLNDWGMVRDRVMAENLLQTRTQSTANRVCREIISRLKMLKSEELNLLVHGGKQEQAQLLWIAICRRYKFIAEFSVEVLRERFISLKHDLHYEDFDYFFNKKIEQYPELEAVKLSSRYKLRQVLFRILKEADLLSANGAINPAMLSHRLLNIMEPKRMDVMFFPVFESELKK